MMTNTNNATADETRTAQRIARKMGELQGALADLADLVASGDLTAEQANQWADKKADQWANGAVCWLVRDADTAREFVAAWAAARRASSLVTMFRDFAKDQRDFASTCDRYAGHGRARGHRAAAVVFDEAAARAGAY
jgi:hypothetical protein